VIVALWAELFYWIPAYAGMTVRSGGRPSHGPIPYRPIPYRSVTYRSVTCVLCCLLFLMVVEKDREGEHNNNGL
jgi:hypothetical protein